MNDRELLEFIAAQVGNLTTKVDGLSNEVRQNSNAIASLENKVDKNLSALYDGYRQNTEAIKELSDKVDVLAEKVEHHDIKIQVIEGGKRA